MAAAKADAKRTVSFFRLVAEDEAGNGVSLKDLPWEKILGTLAGRSVVERTHTASEGQRLIGEVLVVDEDYALKIMAPRDENSWLEILRTDGAEPIDEARLGTLVETSIVAFLPQKNLFGIIRGSTSSPTHVAVGEWIDHLTVEGKRLIANPDHVLRADVALSSRQKQKLDAAGGVSMAKVRIATSQASRLEQAGSAILGRTLREMNQVYGDIVVTVTMRVPRGKQYDAARAELKQETQRLRSIRDAAESISATLITYDAEARQQSEDINFIAQRITIQKNVPLTGDDGEPIRNASAVRAILRAADELRKEIDSVD